MREGLKLAKAGLFVLLSITMLSGFSTNTPTNPAVLSVIDGDTVAIVPLQRLYRANIKMWQRDSLAWEIEGCNRVLGIANAARDQQSLLIGIQGDEIEARDRLIDLQKDFADDLKTENERLKPYKKYFSYSIGLNIVLIIVLLL